MVEGGGMRTRGARAQQLRDCHFRRYASREHNDEFEGGAAARHEARQRVRAACGVFSVNLQQKRHPAEPSSTGLC
jgi:hypothetical protein